jgi:cytochrome c oxidase subunit 3
VTVTLIFLAVIMITVIVWLLRQTLNVQPWVSDPVADAVSGRSLPTHTKTIGLTTFLAVATSLFALFVSAYTLRMQMLDWRPLPEPDLLWINTGFLVLASAAYQWTRSQAIREHASNVKLGLVASGLLSILFLAGQYIAWNQLNGAGYYMSSNPANAFFYLLTAVHGIHLLGGLYVWARSTAKAWSGADAEAVRLSIELCTVYWHFLLLVWVVLFGLLLST